MSILARSKIVTVLLEYILLFNLSDNIKQLSIWKGNPAHYYTILLYSIVHLDIAANSVLNLLILYLHLTLCLPIFSLTKLTYSYDSNTCGKTLCSLSHDEESWIKTWMLARLIPWYIFPCRKLETTGKNETVY